MIRITSIGVVLFYAISQYTASANEAVSIQTLLKEMVDRDEVARYPQTDFRLKQHTSYNRASVSPDDEKGWFANGDFNMGDKARNFIRIEENNGRKEWVMMDHQGAGAIVRSWQPFQSVPKNKIIRIYLDGSDEPVLEGNPCTLFNGTGLIPSPFAHDSLLSAVSFFPIPYAKSCKVTMSELPYFFQFTFREYAEGTEVKTFTMEDFEAAASQMKEVGDTLMTPKAVGGGKPQNVTASLATNEEKSLDLPSGTAAVRELNVKLGDYEDPNVMRTVVLKIEFDGKETVWCPVGDFFGSGIGLNPVQGWYQTVAEDGLMSCRWVMPYKETGRVTLVNFGKESVEASLEVSTGEWTWDDRSMYFHAGWRGQYPVPTMPRSDWNYVTIQGRGVYVADTLTIMNPQPGWWGEGDEKIWVDGEDFPSLFGTGTEDYYAYSWGGLSTDFYEHPFHAQPKSYVYNKLNRKKVKGERNCSGFSVESRSRALDTMPFGKSLQLDMEVWSGTDCDMGYQVGTMWYGDLATTSSHKSEPVEVLNVPPLPEGFGTAQAAEVPVFNSDGIKGAIEIQKLGVTVKSKSIVVIPQSTAKYKGHWNQGDHLFYKGAKQGDVIEVVIPTEGEAKQDLVIYATMAKDFGILGFSVNGKPVPGELDLFSPRVVPTGPRNLGSFLPVDGKLTLRVEVVGQTADSTNSFFALDCISLSDVD